MSSTVENEALIAGVVVAFVVVVLIVVVVVVVVLRRRRRRPSNRFDRCSQIFFSLFVTYLLYVVNLRLADMQTFVLGKDVGQQVPSSSL